jgi:hypothetical protein
MRILNKILLGRRKSWWRGNEERSAKEVEHIQEECLWEDRE